MYGLHRPIRVRLMCALRYDLGANSPLLEGFRTRGVKTLLFAVLNLKKEEDYVC